MPQTTIAVKDANNVTQIINVQNNNGATTSANSSPVVIATDQPPVPVTIANGSDTAVGSMADTAATTDTGTFSILAFIKRGLQNWTSLFGRLPTSLGTKTSANSFSVVLASDYSLPPITGGATAANQATEISSLATIATNSGTAATAANQTTGNTSLATLATNSPTLGPKTASGSIPVTLSTDGLFATNFGATGDTTASWYTTVTGHLALLRLLIATTVGAGSHVYTYTGSNLTSDAWTLLGTTRTKTYTYTGSNLTAESDWV